MQTRWLETVHVLMQMRPSPGKIKMPAFDARDTLPAPPAPRVTPEEDSDSVYRATVFERLTARLESDREPVSDEPSEETDQLRIEPNLSWWRAWSRLQAEALRAYPGRPFREDDVRRMRAARRLRGRRVGKPELVYCTPDEAVACLNTIRVAVAEAVIGGVLNLHTIPACAYKAATKAWGRAMALPSSYVLEWLVDDMGDLCEITSMKARQTMLAAGTLGVDDYLVACTERAEAWRKWPRYDEWAMFWTRLGL